MTKPQSHENIKDLLSEQLASSLTSPTKSLSDQQLFSLDFSTLPARQLALLQKLSFFSAQKSMLKMLTTVHGQAKSKQHFIKDNIGYLTTSQSLEFSTNSTSYQHKTFTIPIYTTCLTTGTAFLLALWRLPSRISTVKYTLGGFVVGLVGSYGYWKYSMWEYYGVLNRLVGVVTRERFQMARK